MGRDAYEQGLIELRTRQDVIEGEMERLAMGQEAVQGQLASMALVTADNQKQLATLVHVTAENQKQLAALVQETRDLIQLYRDARGAARIGAKIQSCLIWVTKWPLIGVGVLTLFSSLRAYLKSKGLDL